MSQYMQCARNELHVYRKRQRVCLLHQLDTFTGASMTRHAPCAKLHVCMSPPELPPLLCATQCSSTAGATTCIGSHTARHVCATWRPRALNPLGLASRRQFRRHGDACPAAGCARRSSGPRRIAAACPSGAAALHRNATHFTVRSCAVRQRTRRRCSGGGRNVCAHTR